MKCSTQIQTLITNISKPLNKRTTHDYRVVPQLAFERVITNNRVTTVPGQQNSRIFNFQVPFQDPFPWFLLRCNM